MRATPIPSSKKTGPWWQGPGTVPAPAARPSPEEGRGQCPIRANLRKALPPLAGGVEGGDRTGATSRAWSPHPDPPPQAGEGVLKLARMGRCPAPTTVFSGAALIGGASAPARQHRPRQRTGHAPAPRGGPPI